MRELMRVLSLSSIIAIAACVAAPGASDPEQVRLSAEQAASVSGSDTIPTLREIGSRGFFVLDGPFAEFDPNHPSVEIWTPESDPNAPIMVYAHGGAGYREDDRARVEMFRRNGFATISFDSYEMNGFEDWNFVTRQVANSGKQSMIWGVFRGAVEHAANSEGWDNRNIFLYGGSNGGRTVLYAGSEIENENIRGIISEAPAGSGFALGDYDIPTAKHHDKVNYAAGRQLSLHRSGLTWRRRRTELRRFRIGTTNPESQKAPSASLLSSGPQEGRDLGGSGHEGGARLMVTAFVQARCGVVSPEAPCRCERRVAEAMRLGRVEKGRPTLEGLAQSSVRLAEVRARVATLERDRAAAALMRSNPNFTTEMGQLVLKTIDGD